MTTNDKEARAHLIHLAERAATVMEAVAEGFRHGDGTAFNIADAANHIGPAHVCDLDAALLVIAHMLTDVRCDLDQWRGDIPRFVATIALADHE